MYIYIFIPNINYSKDSDLSRNLQVADRTTVTYFFVLVGETECWQAGFPISF